MRKILLTGITLIFIEIALFILVGQIIGVFSTLLLILLTSVLGIYIAKKKGAKSVRNVQHSFQEGNAPGPAMIDTMLIFVGGILLIIPGFLSDLIGLLMLFSPTRKLFKPVIFMWMRKKMKNGQMIIIQR